MVKRESCAGEGGSGLTYVVSSGCISGSGTSLSPIVINLDPTGLLACGAAGVRYTGPTGTGGGGLTSVVTAGCIAGSGTGDSPVTLTINPTGLIQCTAGGLAFSAPTGMLDGADVAGCITGNGLTSPLQVQLNATGLIQCTSTGLAFSGPTGILFNGVTTTTCISGNGLTDPIGIRIDPTGLLTCGAGGLRLLNAPTGVGGGTTENTSLSLGLVGSGTHAAPTSEVNLVYNNASGTNTIDIRPVIYFTMGQIGTIAADGNIDDQPRFIVPEGFQVQLCRVYLTVGNPGSTDTDVQIQLYNPTVDCTEPTTNGTPLTETLTASCTWARLNAVEGIILDSLEQMTFRVLTPGTDATNIVCHFWARVTVCFEP